MSRPLLPRCLFWGTMTLVGGSLLPAYPLDGYSQTGIRRLLLYQRIQEGQIPGNFRLPPGALLSSSQIVLRLRGQNETYDVTDTTHPDPELQEGLRRIFESRDPSYGVALLDITDPAKPRLASLQADQGYVPGSVAKILVMTALFDQLRRLFPESIQERIRCLRGTRITADNFVLPNSHQVPVVAPDLLSVVHRAIRVGDEFTLWEWLDHMISPSSNAAGSMVWKQALLMDRFGPSYPPTPAQEAAFLAQTPKNELTEQALRVLEEPLRQAGLKVEDLRLGTFFTANASRVIPGRSSYATPRQLLRWLIRLEQGRLVDSWSSLEMKKTLYFTRRRYRYAASPALDHSAVFFKSGSLYRCRPEPGYRCGQYRGNALNLMHSVAIVESPGPPGSPPRVYLLAMMSNVLKVNSAQEHLELATLIEGLIQDLHSRS